MLKNCMKNFNDMMFFNKLDVILKIETKYAVANLTEILLSAMKSKSIGVMIARGDLAVETGWDSIGKSTRGNTFVVWSSTCARSMGYPSS